MRRYYIDIQRDLNKNAFVDDKDVCIDIIDVEDFARNIPATANADATPRGILSCADLIATEHSGQNSESVEKHIVVCSLSHSKFDQTELKDVQNFRNNDFFARV